MGEKQGVTKPAQTKDFKLWEENKDTFYSGAYSWHFYSYLNKIIILSNCSLRIFVVAITMERGQIDHNILLSLTCMANLNSKRGSAKQNSTLFMACL